MNVKYFYTFVALMFVFSMSFAQQKKGSDVWKKSVTVKAFKSSMKDKKYGDAKNGIDGAIKKYEDAKKDAQLYQLKTEALNELIIAENRKIYLKQKPDTAQYFKYMYDLYETGLICDSLEQVNIKIRTNAGKKASAKYRPIVASRMMTYRKKILTAGKYFYTKKDYKTAFRFFDMYAETKHADIFSDKAHRAEIEEEDNLTEVASLALLSSYASSNNPGVIKYLAESLKNKMLEKNILEIGSKANAAVGDSLEMVNLLENGFYKFPESEYFFMSLIKYYNDHAMYEKALVKSVRMTELFSDNRDYWFVRAKEEMLLEMYEDAKSSFEKCVEIKADDAESYSALGNIYLYEAHEKYSQFNLPRNHPDYESKKLEINDAYRKSLENFEASKKFNENKTSLWLDGLREVYFKLNKGKELKSLDKYK